MEGMSDSEPMDAAKSGAGGLARACICPAEYLTYGKGGPPRFQRRGGGAVRSLFLERRQYDTRDCLAWTARMFLPRPSQPNSHHEENLPRRERGKDESNCGLSRIERRETETVGRS